MAKYLSWIRENKVARALFIAIILVFLLIFFAAWFASVPLGYKAVVTSAPDAKYIGITLDERWHINPYFLLCSIELIRYNSQSVEFIGQDLADDNYGSIVVRSNDNLEVFMVLSVIYHIPADKASSVRLKYGDHKHTILEQDMQRSA
ncbi:MAG: hypothetical protein QW520_04605 [Methanomassiliicoccales archaeon]